MNRCNFCDKLHISLGDKPFNDIPYWYHKSSYELLIMILKDLREFIDKNRYESTLRESITCYCKFSLLVCDEETLGRKNEFIDSFVFVFTGITKLAKELIHINLLVEFIDKICYGLWDKHEQLLGTIDAEQEEKFKHAR